MSVSSSKLYIIPVELLRGFTKSGEDLAKRVKELVKAGQVRVVRMNADDRPHKLKAAKRMMAAVNSSEAASAIAKLTNSDLLDALIEQKQAGKLPHNKEGLVTRLVDAEERALKHQAETKGLWLSGYGPANIKFVHEKDFKGNAKETIERLRQVSNETVIRLRMEAIARRLAVKPELANAEPDSRLWFETKGRDGKS